MTQRGLFGTGQRTALSVASRRGAYDDLNIDPYAKRKITPGQRQEDYKDILAHGERSDTDWNKAVKQNIKALKDTFHTNETGWAKRDQMDEVSRLLYEGAINQRKAEDFSGKYYRPGTTMSETFRDRGYQEASAEQWSEFETQASQANQTTMAKWMAAYNKATNQSERIALSEKRTAYRQRFADMQVQNERSARKRTRTINRRGTQGLTVGSGAGVGLGI